MIQNILSIAYISFYFRSTRLKQKLKISYPNLVFHLPAKQSKSNVVYAETVQPGPLLEHFRLSPSISSEDDKELPSTSGISKSASNDVHNLYNAAMIMRAQLGSGDNPLRDKWPPLADDLNIPVAESMIPVPLYNFTAWMLGISQEVTLEKFVEVEKLVHLKMLSLLQDLLYLESKGQKPTPKHYFLGMMLHHLSGSSSIVRILNKLGHGSSRLVVSSLETALAQLQASSNELQIPTGFCSAYTTVVWDNIDFSEETVSGKGTTHHTNGIIVQRLSISNMPMPSYTTEQTFLPKRKHVVDSQPIKVLPYTKNVWDHC